MTPSYSSFSMRMMMTCDIGKDPVDDGDDELLVEVRRICCAEVWFVVWVMNSVLVIVSLVVRFTVSDCDVRGYEIPNTIIAITKATAAAWVRVAPAFRKGSTSTLVECVSRRAGLYGCHEARFGDAALRHAQRRLPRLLRPTSSISRQPNHTSP